MDPISAYRNILVDWERYLLHERQFPISISPTSLNWDDFIVYAKGNRSIGAIINIIRHQPNLIPKKIKMEINAYRYSYIYHGNDVLTKVYKNF